MHLADYVTLKQAAEMVDLSKRTLQNHLADIPHQRIGREVVFLPADLEAWKRRWEGKA